MPRIGIIGGSHTAFSVAATLLEVSRHLQQKATPVTPRSSIPQWVQGLLAGLKGMKGFEKFILGDASITIYHRGPVRISYRDIDSAVVDGYNDYSKEDISPSGRVNPFGGLRWASKDLYKKILSRAERRVRIIQAPHEPHEMPLEPNNLEDMVRAWKDCLNDVDVAVWCGGFGARDVPIIDTDGTRVRVKLDKSGRQVVDDNCRLLRDDGQPIGPVLAMGLGYGMNVNSPLLDGESRSDLRADGFDLYCNTYGKIILRNVLGTCK